MQAGIKKILDLFLGWDGGMGRSRGGGLAFVPLPARLYAKKLPMDFKILDSS